MPDAVLTLNSGSSSIKLALFEIGEGGALTNAFNGLVEEIGASPHFVAHDAGGQVLAEQRWDSGAPSHEELLGDVLDFVDSHLGADRLRGAGHRVVHGGRDHAGPARVDAALIESLDALSPLAPLHQPHNLEAISAIAALRPDLPQVACFDTAFHRTMPRVATRFAIPRDLDEQGVRRYGFHGLSYAYIAGRLREVAPDLAGGRVIVAHLGNGASLCAMAGGRSVDTTMGFTALDGLVMGTRCGVIDAGVLLYLQQAEGMSVKDVEKLLYSKSGLLGVSGFASDMRRLHASDDPRAAEAIELFVYRLAREAAGLVSSLGGLDGIVFTAGIGEHDAAVRAAVCQRLAWLGVRLDATANERGDPVISAADSAIVVRVMPTDEEAMIARETVAVLHLG